MAQVRVSGYAPAPNESTAAEIVVITPTYHDVMEIPIVDGRPFNADDRPATERVAIVNQAFVRRFAASRSIVGAQVDHGDGWARVVAVARDAATQSLGEAPPPLVYLPFSQGPASNVTLHVRTAVPPRALVDAVRQAFASVNPELPVLDPGTLAEHIAAARLVPTVAAVVITLLGLCALAVTTVGAYGMVTQVVTARRRELAIRAAVGASPPALVRGCCGIPLAWPHAAAPQVWWQPPSLPER